MNTESRTNNLVESVTTLVELNPIRVLQPESHWLYNYGPITEWFFTPAITGLFEIHTPDDRNRRRTWNNYQHYKSVAELPVKTGSKIVSSWYFLYDWADTSFWSYHYGYAPDNPLIGYSGFGGDGTPTTGLPLLYVPTADDGFIPEPAELEDLKQRALRYTLPIIQTEVSLMNSLIELRDIKSLPRSLKNIGTVLKSVKAVVAKQRLKLLGKPGIVTVHELLRAAASGYLEYSFNIATLMSDIRGVYTSLQLLEARVNALITASAKTHVKHYSVVLNEYNDEEYETPISLTSYQVGSRRLAGRSKRFTSYGPSKFHMQIEYNYNYTRYQVEHARILAFLDMMGAGRLTSVVWNALPWSFVIDWVVGVSRYIEQFQSSHMAPVINIHRADRKSVV